MWRRVSNRPAATSCQARARVPGLLFARLMPGVTSESMRGFSLVPTLCVGTRQLASASHQLHVGGFRVKRRIGARLVLTLERRLRLIASRFVEYAIETRAPDPTRINLVAR